MRYSRSLSLALLALLYTLLNCVKPLQVDDAAYYYYARHIAEHPLEPYGFEIHWYQWPSDANHVLAPPVVPYWWAGAIRLFGDRPFLWKLWLLPFSVAFVFSLHALARRFARGLETALVVMTVLSPSFLPSLNLMLDVPALALGLFALTFFFRGCDRLDLAPTLAAGLAAGLAMETKYTGFLAPAVMVLYAFVSASRLRETGALVRAGKVGFALIAVLVALNAFAWWEAFVAVRHGESHFFREYRLSDRDWMEQLDWSLPLLVLLGGVASPLILLGWAGRGWHRLSVLWGGVGLLAGYALVAGVGATVRFQVDEAFFTVPVMWLQYPLPFEYLVFFPFGVVLAGTVLVTAWQLLRVPRAGWWPPRRWFQHRSSWFLVLWLVLEVAGYFVLTPFGAVRRIMGVVVAATLLLGRRASLAHRSLTVTAHPTRSPTVAALLVYAVVGLTVCLGLLFYVVDVYDALASERAAESAAAQIRAEDPQAVTWYVGHWGFQFYAERAGMKAVVPDRQSAPLRRGDWLVVPDGHIEQQEIRLDPDCLQKVDKVMIGDCLPLRTVRCFYGTGTGVPLEHLHGPRIGVTIYRVRRDFVPVSAWLPRPP